MDGETYVLMLSTCGDANRRSVARAIEGRYEELRTDFLARGGRDPRANDEDVFVIETNCFRDQQFDDDAAKLRRKLAATRKALDTQHPR